MTDRIHTLLLSLTVIVVLIFSAIGPTIAYADGGTTTEPPPTDTSIATSTSDSSTVTADSSDTTNVADSDGDNDGGTTATPAPTSDSTGQTTVEATATPVPTDLITAGTTDQATTTQTTKHHKHKKQSSDTQTTDTTTATTDAATTDATAVDAAAPTGDTATATSDSTVLNTVPENTTVTVLDENGQSQPLASQDAAQAIATTSDPIWCPATQTTPTPGANGCTDSFPSFDALLTALAGSTTYTGAGTIYVQQGAYTGSGTIDFNSYNLSNISSSDLTVTGGWNTSTNTVDPAATSDFTDTAIVIGSPTNLWGGSLTINNLNMAFTTTFSNDAANAAMNGLTLYSQGDVNLNNVTVTNAPNDGADINAGRDVNVNNSKFERNQKTGALIKASGMVSVANSSFSNPANGRRQDTGLDITSSSDVSLFDVLANTNRVAGTNINTAGRVTIGGTALLPDGTCANASGICGSFFSGTKLMNGSGTAATFEGYGLNVVSTFAATSAQRVAIALDNVTGNDNFLYGATLTATLGDVAVQNSVFNANTTASPGFIDDTGLVIHAGTSGVSVNNVDLNNVTTNQNRLYGTVIDATGTVSVNNGTFSNNNGTTTTGGVTEYHGVGLQVNAGQSINLNNVIASNDMLFGGKLNAAGDVNIANSTFSNCTTCNPNAALGVGLDVVSGGNTSLSNVVLDKNQTVGANIQAGANVFLDGVTATNNGTDGVNVKQALCTELNGGTYSGNGQYGLNLGTSPLDVVTAPTFANNGAGDMNPANPPTCSIVIGTPTTAASPAGTPQTASALDTKVSGNQVTNTATGAFFTTAFAMPVTGTLANNNAGAATLSSFVSISKVSGGTLASIFFGQYAYVYSSAGMQIVAYAPSSTELVKG